MTDAGTMYANAKALHELLQEARAENAKLVMKLNAEHIVRQNIAADNVRLRELVRDMWLHSYCSIAKSREDDDRHVEDVIDRMRELGVEV